MSNYYIYLVLGPKVYSKYYADLPEPGEVDLYAIKREINSMKKSSSMRRIKNLFGLSEDLAQILQEEDPDRDKEIYECMVKIPITPITEQMISIYKDGDSSLDEIVPQIPLSSIIQALDTYTNNPIVKATLGATAETTYDMLTGHKTIVIPHYLGYKYCVVHFKLGVSDPKGNILRKDYYNMIYFLADKIFVRES
jgi:hypothetical protein